METGFSGCETRLSHVRIYGRNRLIADRGGLARPRSGMDEDDDDPERKFFQRSAILVLGTKKKTG